MGKHILLLSDIHGNFPALRAVEHFFAPRAFDGIINCGDSIVYAPFPNEVLAWLAENEAVSILGNTDKKVMRLLNNETFIKPRTFEKRIMYTSTAVSLNKASKDYLFSLPQKTTFTLNAASGTEQSTVQIGVFHGSPAHPNEFLFPDTPKSRFHELAQEFPMQLIVTGHSHTPYHKRVGTTHFINPGSVGRMFDGDPRASCAILSLKKHKVTVEHFRIPYPIELVTQRLKEEHLPKIYRKMYRKGKKLN